MLTPVALAGDFDHGKTADGCYYYSETHDVAYNKDASGITDVGHCASAQSTAWYANRVIGLRRASDVYQNRINAMKILLAK